MRRYVFDSILIRLIEGRIESRALSGVRSCNPELSNDRRWQTFRSLWRNAPGAGSALLVSWTHRAAHRAFARGLSLSREEHDLFLSIHHIDCSQCGVVPGPL